jgi:hypothetical protein
LLVFRIKETSHDHKAWFIKRMRHSCHFRVDGLYASALNLLFYFFDTRHVLLVSGLIFNIIKGEVEEGCVYNILCFEGS